jgi:hypothetical protein
MAALGSQATRRAVELLTGEERLAEEVSRIAARYGMELPWLGVEQVCAQSVSHELAEKTTSIKYPRVYIYCEGLANQIKEKFRTFSGKVYMAAEIRVTHDHLEKVTDQLLGYVEAVTNLLERSRGVWGPGLYYTGGYKVEFGAVKQGGKNFLQGAKIRFELDASAE